MSDLYIESVRHSFAGRIVFFNNPYYVFRLERKDEKYN